MLPLRRRFLRALIFGGCLACGGVGSEGGPLGLLGRGGRLSAATPVLPPLSGELRGELKIPWLPPEAPALNWTLKLAAGNPQDSERQVEWEATAPGLRLRAYAQLTGPLDGGWQLVESELDLASWYRLISGKYAPAIAGYEAAGKLTVSGAGTLRGGEIFGRIEVELTGGSLRDPAGTWRVDGLAFQGILGDLPTLKSEGAISLEFAEATFGSVTAREGSMEFTLDARSQVAVKRATLAIFGGHVEFTPFSFPLMKPAVQADLHFRSISLPAVAAILPPVINDSAGEISGRMALLWDAEKGLRPGTGRFQMDPGVGARLRLGPQPGFLTKGVQPQLLGDGFLSKIVRVKNPAYESLRAIEMGDMDLELNALDITLTPDGDAAGRTAHVVFTARPQNRKDVESVRFEVNVKGPLADVVRFGLEHDISLKFR